MLPYFLISLLFAITLCVLAVAGKFVYDLIRELYFWIALLIDDLIMKRIVK